MSEENLETVRRAFAESNRGGIDQGLEDWAPDAVWDWSNGRGFDAGVYRGLDEIRAFLEERRAAFEEFRFELVELVEAEPDRVIADNIAYLRGRDGIEVEARSAWLIKFRDGKQISLTLYQSKQEALEAAGLSE